MTNKTAKIKRLILIQIRYFYHVIFKHKKYEDNGVTCIIFSRNRAMQLDALLRSIFYYSKTEIPIIVQYTCDDVHKKSYQEIFNKFKQVKFIEERDFKTTLFDILEGIRTKYLFYLVDDQVFISPFDIRVLLTKMAPNTFASLRLGDNIKKASFADVYHEPQYTKEGNILKWKWRENHRDWNYQFSVDGNIYQTIDVLRCSHSIPFKAPNSYEANMNSVYLFKKDNTGIAYPKPVVTNLVLNASRNEADYEKCANGELSPEDLLSLWEKGKTIDIDKVSNLSFCATHHFLDDINLILKDA